MYFSQAAQVGDPAVFRPVRGHFAGLSGLVVLGGAAVGQGPASVHWDLSLVMNFMDDQKVRGETWVARRAKPLEPLPMCAF